MGSSTMAAMPAFGRLLFLIIGALTGYIYALSANEKLTCLPDITRFSTGASPNHYYECTGRRGGRPTLVECPEGLFYHTKNQTSVPSLRHLMPRHWGETFSLVPSMTPGETCSSRSL